MGTLLPDSDPEHFEPANVVTYLRKRCKTTLRSLHLDFRRLDPTVEGATAGMMPSVREFIALKHLFISVQEIYRDDGASTPDGKLTDGQRLFSLLPDGLETLEFADGSDTGYPTSRSRAASASAKDVERPVPTAA